MINSYSLLGLKPTRSLTSTVPSEYLTIPCKGFSDLVLNLSVAFKGITKQYPFGAIHLSSLLYKKI